MPILPTDAPMTGNVAAGDGVASPNRRAGTMTLILGCMFSGKTTRLLEALGNAPFGTFLLFKHRIDRRYAVDDVVTHAGARLPAFAVDHPCEIRDALRDRTALVAVDEAHFFGPDLACLAAEMTRRGLDVLVTGLDRNSWGRPFAVIEALRPLATRIEMLMSVCARCGCAAGRTQRTSPIRGGTLVGGPESYEPRCDDCWSPPPEPAPWE